MLERLADYARYGIKPDEDAYVIKKHPITTFVAGIEKEASKALKSRKAAFLVMLSELESSPGTKFKTPESLRSLLAGMTEAAFHVQATTLVCKNRDWSGVSGAVQEMLAFHKLEYTVLCCDADSRMKSASKADALKALSSLIENRPGDNVLARDIAFTAMQWGMGGHAYKLLRRVTRMRPYEPQSWQQMATCLEAAGKTDLAMACYEVGLAGNWNARFGEFKKILTVDYLHFLKEIESGKQSVTNKDFAKMRLASLTNSQAHRPQRRRPARPRTERRNLLLQESTDKARRQDHSRRHARLRSRDVPSRDRQERHLPDQGQVLRKRPKPRNNPHKSLRHNLPPLGQQERNRPTQDPDPGARQGDAPSGNTADRRLAEIILPDTPFSCRRYLNSGRMTGEGRMSPSLAPMLVALPLSSRTVFVLSWLLPGGSMSWMIPIPPKAPLLIASCPLD